jgi:Fic family protein
MIVRWHASEFWKKHAAAPLNDRQRDIINRLLDGFDGKLTSSRWAMIEKCSPDTALRDITDLVERGLFKKNEGGGRSTSYSLVEDSAQ